MDEGYYSYGPSSQASVFPAQNSLIAETFSLQGSSPLFWYWKFYDQLTTTKDFCRPMLSVIPLLLLCIGECDCRVYGGSAL